ncbi:MAG: hypothetical protein ACNI3C_00035 [Candidatus Marinarcus sp.]|uniref:hypothetical protein n=1 Tax=Candidatus Marinarcus sp. TaxID=3100987 RepID=UPI003B00DC4B
MKKILFGSVIALALLTGCSDEKVADPVATETPAVQTTEAGTPAVNEETKDESTPAVNEETKDEAPATTEETKEETK